MPRPTLLDAEQETLRQMAGRDADAVIAESGVVRRRMVSLNAAGRLGTLKKLPRLDALSALEHLDVSNNALSALDLAQPPPKLYVVQARNNRLRGVDLAGAHRLEVFDVRDNALTRLDLTPLVPVDEILISGNPLEELKVTDLLLVVQPKLRRAAKRLVVRPATTHEIHYACDRHNWDDGRKLLEWAVKQPQCDPATALLIYFRAQPSFFFDLRKPDAEEARTIRWLRSIEDRFARAKFSPPTVSYSPAKDVGAKELLHRAVPPAMNLQAKAVPRSPKYPYPRVAG